jgi:glycosyltransferase involved in cell wall biosynthesis
VRVLHAIHTVDPAAGGPGEGLRQIVAAAVALGHRHEVVALDAPDAPWVARFPGPMHALGEGRGTYGWHPRLAPWLAAHARAYDAIVVHGLWQYLGLAVRRAALGSMRPYFVYPHGMLDPWFKQHYPLKHLKKSLYWPWGEHRVLRDARAVLFTAQEEALRAAQSFARFPGASYRVRESIVGFGLALGDEARNARAEVFASRFPALQGQRIVLFLGRLHEKKGCDLLLEAFAAVAGNEPALRLVMAGPDAQGLGDALRARAQQLGVADRVLWPGLLTGADKWAAFAAAEVFVLPSHQENFGVAVAEALAMGVPVLLSRRVNIWREIVDARAGLADEDDLRGTTSLLRGWLQLDVQERQRMRSAAVACFDAHFRIEAVVQRLAGALASNAVGVDREPIGSWVTPGTALGRTAIHEIETAVLEDRPRSRGRTDGSPG